MKKRLSNFLYYLSTDKGYVVLALIFTILGIGFFFYINVKSNAFEPPTKEDYKWLYEQEKLLEQDFENVYRIENAQINIQNSEIVVVLTSKENSDYELQITFNSNKEKQKIEEICHKEGYRNTALIYPKLEKYWKVLQCIVFGTMVGTMSSVAIGSLYGILYRQVKKWKKK